MSRPFPPPTFPSIICGVLTVLTVLAVAGALAVPVFAQTNTPPEITSATTFPVDEGTTAIATLTATDAENDALEWSIPAGTAGGADADTFNLTDTGGLTFTTAQDYEAPDDTDGDGTYKVTVQVSDTSATAPGETYVYQVKALRGAEASQGSNQASATKPHSCEGEGFNSTPEDVPVTAVPIVVTSTTADYFVLFVRPDLDADLKIPISVTLGEEGATTLTEQLSPLPKEHYLVEKYSVDDPADVDRDCISDIEELADLGTLNPINQLPKIDFRHGTVAIPDRETFERLSYKGTNVLMDDHLTDLEFVKFFIIHRNSSWPAVYFMNTVTHRAHYRFSLAVRHPRDGMMKGEIVYHPDVEAPDGSLGVYRFEFEPRDAYPFEAVRYAYEVLAASMPLLENNLAYYPMPGAALPLYQEERASYDDSRINMIFEADIFPDVDFLSLNRGTGYGYLRVMGQDERPNPRDIVIYESLPNDLPRVAGIITTVAQTPLSHVNLRALQDRVPNAFVRDALDDATIDSLIDSHVRYTVTRSGYTIRAATKAEVDAHYDASRPAATQTPERDLAVTAIKPLSDIEFGDWTAFGVKAANVAVLGTLGFPDGTVPDGFAVPFYFYDGFMKANDLYTTVSTMLADPDFQTDYDTQEDKLKKLRKAIKGATTPDWIITALEEMHGEFPDGTSLRYRSSTNNEDLPGFSGAGLYDSKTQDPDETEEDGIDKSIKGVWASLWNFRAFVEREFHRIDHLTTAMGVLVHPNYSDELANGVAVSYDPINAREGVYYVNTQIGEDLVTNPDANSVPEELLLLEEDSYEVLVYSNQVESEQLLMSDAQIEQLRGHLTTIHDKFDELYDPAADERFAMEIEFKITSEDVLAIKQARPWVFRPLNEPPEFPSTETGVRQVAEGTPLDAEIGAPVAASDAEGDVLTYALSGPDAGSFLIVPETGALMVWTDLDYETQATYSVTVEVHDGRDSKGQPNTSRDDWVTVSILLTNVNEKPTLTGPIAINDYAEHGTGPVATYRATDPERDPIQWTVDSAAFTINDGVLRFRTPPDYEAASSYFVTVEVSDGEFTDELPVTVSVTNEDEAGSLTLSSVQPQVDTALTATLTDPDGPVSTDWVWERSQDNKRTWEPVKGTPAASYTPETDDVGAYLRVTATYTDGTGSDKRVPPLIAPYAVRQTRVKNDPPAFTGSPPTLTVGANAGAGSRVGAPVRAEDPGDPLTYTLDEKDPDAACFDIDWLSGQIAVGPGGVAPCADPVTRSPGQRTISAKAEEPKTYQLTVLATDPSGESADIPVFITVSSSPPPPPPPPPRGGGGGGGPVCADDVHANTAAQATGIALDTVTAGALCPATDVDYFTVTAPNRGVVFVDTFGGVQARGTIWQNDVVLASGSTGGQQNDRLGVLMQAGPVVVAVQGQGGATGAYDLEITFVQGYLENPGADSFQSGVGVLSGWVCEAEAVEIELNGIPQEAAYGTERLDTLRACGDTDNGFGLLFNWNLLRDGEHEVVALVDGVELGRATVTVTTLGQEFLRDVTGTCEAEDFPVVGERATLVWQQTSQNFVIAGGNPPAGATTDRMSGLTGYLENPGPNSFQSGVGVLSGWVCDADQVEIEIGNTGRQVAAYGTERVDTLDTCGDTGNGFGLLFNWNLLGEGEHEVIAYVDGEELGRATVRVTTLGAEFLRGVEGECVVADFPTLGETVTLEWQQSSQNFVITDVAP